MKILAPSYYPLFSCIGGACRHTCCAGWEIDIDPDTLAYYRTVGGEIGARLRDAAAYDESDGCAHFLLTGEDERCPFLNRDNLCDLILQLGEGALCQICTDHPRYRSFFTDRTETGIGLCCEAAARLILGYEMPVSWICLSDDRGMESLCSNESECLALRESVVSALQNRGKPIHDRIADMLSLCEVGQPVPPPPEFSDFLSGLEYMEADWRDMLMRLPQITKPYPIPALCAEQFLVYLVIRHFPKMTEGEDKRVLAAFAAFSYELISWLYAVREKQDFDTLSDLVRMFSSEIEYSEENLSKLFLRLSLSCR